MKTLALIVAAASMLLAQAPAKDAKKPAKPAAVAPAKPEAAKPAPAKPAEAAKPATKTEKPVAGGLVGNKDSKTFHKADCKTIARMKDTNRVALASKEEAEKQGYKACKVCFK